MLSSDATLLFVYGTLKRGCVNHHVLAGQTLVGETRTVAGYRLYHLGEYPGLVAAPDDDIGVSGEVWLVDPAALARLDAFEGLAQGLYRREPVPLLPPFADRRVESYLYNLSVLGRAPISDGRWAEP